MTQQNEKGGLGLVFGMILICVAIGAGGLGTYLKMNPTSFIAKFLVPDTNPQKATPHVAVKLPQEVVQLEKVKKTLAQPLASFDLLAQNYDGTEDAYTILRAAERKFFESVKPLIGDATCLNSQHYVDVVAPTIVAINTIPQSTTTTLAPLRQKLGEYVTEELKKIPPCSPVVIPENKNVPQETVPQATTVPDSSQDTTQSPNITKPNEPKPTPAPSSEVVVPKQ